MRVAVGTGVATGKLKVPALSKSSAKPETQPYSNSRKRASGWRGAIIYHFASSLIALKTGQVSPSAVSNFNSFAVLYFRPGPVRTLMIPSL